MTEIVNCKCNQLLQIYQFVHASPPHCAVPPSTSLFMPPLPIVQCPQVPVCSFYQFIQLPKFQYVDEMFVNNSVDPTGFSRSSSSTTLRPTSSISGDGGIPPWSPNSRPLGGLTEQETIDTLSNLVNTLSGSGTSLFGSNELNRTSSYSSIRDSQEKHDWGKIYFLICFLSSYFILKFVKLKKLKVKMNAY